MNELTMTLASHNGTPLYEQIYLYIKENIVTGKFAYREKLPSTRALARGILNQNLIGGTTWRRLRDCIRSGK